MKLTRVAAWSAAGVLGIGGLAGAAGAAAGLPGDGATVPVAGVAAAGEGDAAGAAANDKGTDARKRRGVLRRVEHGEFVVRTKDGHRTFHVQRGTLTAASASAVTVTSADGFTQTWAVTADTRIRKNKKDIPASALTVGDRVRVLGPESGGAVSANRIRVLKPTGERK